MTDMRYCDANEVARLLGYRSGRQITERVSRVAGFPVPVRFPTGAGGLGHPRWRDDELIAWAEAQRVAA